MQIGYQRDFLGADCIIPMPTFGRSLAQSVYRNPDRLREGVYSDHIHFSIVMNEDKRSLVYSAFNLDQAQLAENTAGLGEQRWQFDPNVSAQAQLDNDYYKDRDGPDGTRIYNPYDRGHMVMRKNAMWGPTRDAVDRAGKATYIYSNASLQHENLNRDEWVTLETEVVQQLKLAPEQKLTIFTGPIYGHLDRSVHISARDSARVPSGFFKVICFKRGSGDLGVLTFVIYQDDAVLRDKRGGATVKTDTRYQITIRELERQTGITFGEKLFNANPLIFYEDAQRNQRLKIRHTPERIPYVRADDLVTDQSEIRCAVEPLGARRILIHAAMINPTAPEAEHEWVSLFNRGSDDIAIDGWRLVDGQGREATLRGHIAAGQAKQLGGAAKGKIKLANSGGSLILYDAQNCIIDHVTWSQNDLAKVEEDMAYMFERGQ